MRYVIIGNSTAAVGAVEGIRSVDGTGEIILISKEPEHTYARPLISYLLCGKTTREKMRYRPADFYTKNKARLVFSEVTRIDAASKTVTLAGGQLEHYDKLLVATGSRPFVPRMDGIETVEHKTTFLSLDDALAIQTAIRKDTQVLIIGAGLIGLKCAEGIWEQVQSITVVDLADRVLPSVLTPDAARLVQRHIEEKGIRCILADSVQSFDGQQAVLKSGKTIAFDLLVVAVGVQPNSGLIKEAGGAVNRGIVTDERMQTTLADVYAAGDCAESFDLTTGTQRVLAILPNAYAQGECAGINMAGGAKEYPGTAPMNAMGLLGLHLVTAGSYDGTPLIASPTQSDGGYRQFYEKDGVLNGFILLGDIRRAGIYTSILKDRTPLAQLDPKRLLERPQLLAFSKADRIEKLGGVPLGH